jgi:glucose uptake protein
MYQPEAYAVALLFMMVGVLIWKEFASAPLASRKLIPAMVVFFLLGLGSIAVAPLVAK